MGKRKDSRQTAKKAPPPINGKSLRDAVAWAIDRQIFAQLKLHGNTTWKIVDLILSDAFGDEWPHQRPVQFHVGPLRCPATQFAPAERLLHGSELQLNPPAELIQANRLRVGQRLRIQHIRHQMHRTPAYPQLQMPKHQRRFALAGGGVGPARHDPCSFANVAQVTQQRHVGSNPDQKRVAGVAHRFPQLIARKAGISAKQRLWGEFLLDQDLPKVIPLGGVRRPCFPTPRHVQAHVPKQRDPHLRLDRLHMCGFAAQASASLLRAVPGRFAFAEIRGAESPLVFFSTRHADARAIDCERYPASNAPVPTPVFFHKEMQTIPQQRQPRRRPMDERLEQALICRDRRSSDHIDGPALSFDKSSGQSGLVRPHPDDRQQDQIDNLPCRIAMQLQLGEDLPIDGPGDCVTQRLAIDRWWGLLGRLPRILSLSHIARLLKRPRRSRWLGWESGIFFDSLNYINPVFYERKSFTALPIVAYNSDGSRIASFALEVRLLSDGGAGTSRLWDAGTGKEIAVLGKWQEFGRRVAFSPDGKRVAVGSREYVYLCDTGSGRQLAVLGPHAKPVVR